MFIASLGDIFTTNMRNTSEIFELIDDALDLTPDFTVRYLCRLIQDHAASPLRLCFDDEV